MTYQISDDPGIEEIEVALAQMQKSISPTFDLVSDFRATLKRAEPMVRVAEAVAEAMVNLSRADRDPKDLTGRLIRGVSFELKGIKHTMRLNHGPLEPIFPGHCHEKILICNPFGETCIEIELPWFCDPDEPPGNPDDDPIVIF